MCQECLGSCWSMYFVQNRFRRDFRNCQNYNLTLLNILSEARMWN